MTSDRFAAEVAALAQRLARARRVGRPLVVYGSSTVRLWADPGADLRRDDVVAVGFGGATLLDLERHYDVLVAPLAPALLVVAAGANDLEQLDLQADLRAGGASVPEAVSIVARVEALLARARRHDASLPVQVLTLKPAPFHAARMPAILAANQALAEATRRWRKVELVDTCTPFLGADGQADARFYADDRRHMNAHGQALWVQLLGQALPPAAAPAPTRP